jgi:predicted acylesterase/phospholipase RssA
MMNRLTAIVTMSALTPAALPLAIQAQAESAPERASVLQRALVLSGGGALGSYEAGIIAALGAQFGTREGQPLGPYDLVCGASIGAFNAYLVATAQYEKLRSLWDTVASAHVVRFKHAYAAIPNPSSGVLTRLTQKIALSTGLAKHETGAFDGAYLRAWMLQYVDFDRPVVTPMIWPVTNVSAQRPEYFYLARAGATPASSELALAALRLALGPNIPVRPASRELLVDQLRASAALPIAFDPVALPDPDGTMAQYVDGGIIANTPLRVAAALALRVDAVLLNPPFERGDLSNAVDVTLAAYGAMQRRLMETDLRSTYFQSFVLKALRALQPQITDEVARRTDLSAEQLHHLAEALSETNLYLIRPKSTLPVKIFEFDDAASISAAYQLGLSDGAAGFVPFDPTLVT